MYLDLAGFKNRTTMSPADVDRIVRTRFEKPNADATAAATTPETRFGEVVVTGNVVTLLATFAGALAHDAANYAMISVYKRTAGGAPVLLGSIDTSTTDIPAGVPIALTLNGSPPAIAAEDILTAKITKTGSGVIVPSFTLDLRPTPNFVEAKIASVQAWLEARLRKRYIIPLDKNRLKVPETALLWIARIVTRECYGRRGFNPTSEQDAAMVLELATTAEAEIKEASDSETGLFDLPLNEGDPDDVSGVAEGFPLSYSETSPYVAFDRQICDGLREDSSGRGSS